MILNVLIVNAKVVVANMINMFAIDKFFSV
jgi:hypothetical protein